MTRSFRYPRIVSGRTAGAGAKLADPPRRLRGWRVAEALRLVPGICCRQAGTSVEPSCAYPVTAIGERLWRSYFESPCRLSAASAAWRSILRAQAFWRRPEIGIRLHRVGVVFQQGIHHLDAPQRHARPGGVRFRISSRAPVCAPASSSARAKASAYWVKAIGWPTRAEFFEDKIRRNAFRRTLSFPRTAP